MRKSASLVWLAIVLLLTGYLSLRVAHGLNFQTDLMALLPQEQQNAALQSANESVTRALARHVVILVGDTDRDKARKAATEITRQMDASGLFDLTASLLDNDRLSQIGKFYYPYRAGLLANDDRDLLKEGRGDEIASRALAQIYGVLGTANAKLLQSDPFLLLPNFLIHLPAPLSRFSLDDGLLSLHDGYKTWILIPAQIKGEAFALDTQRRVVAAFDAAALSQKILYPELDILHLGAVFFAKAGADQAMSETSLIGVVSTIGIVVLMLLMFRAVRPLLLGLLVIAVGVIVALSASLWIYGTLHVMALLFGITLIGVATDYTLQYCSEVFTPSSGAPWERLKRVRMGITLGAATTIIGYLTLYFAPFPGLHQIAAFSAIGLAASWLTVVLWLPVLDKPQVKVPRKPFSKNAEKLLAFWEEVGHKKTRRFIFISILLVVIAGFIRFHSDDDVRHMQALPHDLVSEQRQIENLTGVIGGGPFFIVQAPNDEIALQREEQLTDRLRPLLANHGLSGFQSVSQYIPSQVRQNENRVLQRDKLYRPLLEKQTISLNLSTPPQMPDEQPVLKLANLKQGDGPFAWISNLMFEKTDAGVTHIVMLQGVADTALLKEAATGIEGVHYIDPTTNFSNLFGKYRKRALFLIALSALLMLPLLIVRYGFAKGLWVMVPPLLAVVLAPSLRSLWGNAFTFFDAMALVLILSIGVDYAVFFAETSNKRKTVTMLAVGMAAATALMSFGLLALSHVEAVHNFGTTMTIGILLSFLFSPLAILSGKNRIFSPRHLIALACVMLLCGCAGETQAPTPRAVTAVSIAPDVLVTMPDPATLKQSIEVAQMVSVHYGSQDFAFEAHISVTPERFLLVGLDMMGRQMFRITWTKDGILYDKADWVPSDLKPENILADIMLLYWPPKIVQQSLTGSEARLIAYAKHREIMLKGQKIWEADYHPSIKNDLWSGSLHYSNDVWGYAFDIQSIEINP